MLEETEKVAIFLVSTSLVDGFNRLFREYATYPRPLDRLQNLVIISVNKSLLTMECFFN